MKLLNGLLVLLSLSLMAPANLSAQTTPKLDDARFQLADGSLNRIGPLTATIQLDVSGEPGEDLTVWLRSKEGGAAPKYGIIKDANGNVTKITKVVTLDANGKGSVTFSAPNTTVGWTYKGTGLTHRGLYIAEMNYGPIDGTGPELGFLIQRKNPNDQREIHFAGGTGGGGTGGGGTGGGGTGGGGTGGGGTGGGV